MATTDQTNGAAVVPYDGIRKAFVIRNTLDCAAVNVPSGDTVKALNIKAGWLVERVVAIVKTPEGGTLTVDIGDGDDPDGYLDGSDGNATAGTVYNNAVAIQLSEGTPNTAAWVGYGQGRYYKVADTIDVLFNNAADAAVIELIAFVVDLS